MTPIRVLLVDDHPIVRDGLKMLLTMNEDIAVVGEANNGVEALRLAQNACPDVAILDIGMPEMNGIECAEKMHLLCPQTAIIMLSIHGTSEYVIRAVHAGAKAYLLKDSLSREIIRAIRAVHDGQYIVSRKLAERLMELDLDAADLVTSKSPLATLSPQEQRVLQYVVEGMTSAEIADVLFLSAKTVETYRSRIMTKLGIENLPELVKFAILHGITSLDI